MGTKFLLTKIIQHFPAIQNLATVIEKRVEKVCEEEKDKRQDLYIKARSYQGQLVSRKSKMMREGDFHAVKGKKEEPAAAESPTKENKKEKEKERDKDGVEEGEIKDKKEKRHRSSTGESKERSRDSVSKERSVRDSESKERGRESHGRGERDSQSRDRGDMGPPRERATASTPRRSLDPDHSDRDPKRRREERVASPPKLDRLEKKEKAKREKERKEKEGKERKEKEGKEEKETSSAK